MGACFDEFTLDGKLSEREVKSRFEAYQKECAIESGSSYSGRLNMCNGLEFAQVRVFESYNEAENYLQNKCQKWENAIAVQYLESNPVKKDDSKLVKLRQDLETLRRELVAFERDISSRVESRLKSVEKIKCLNCKSHLDTRFRAKTLKCPVCDASFASKTDLKKHETLKGKIQKAETKLSEYQNKLQVKANSKNRATRWLIGGVCSS